MGAHSHHPICLLMAPVQQTCTAPSLSLGHGHPSIPCPLNLTPHHLICASSHGCKCTPAPSETDCAGMVGDGQRWAQHPSLTLPNLWGLGQGELGQPLPPWSDG